MSLSDSKVTDNTHEMSFSELVSQTLQLRIPLFQRAYVWTGKQLDRMFRELDSILDGEDKNRFLGAIIAVRRHNNPAEPQRYEIVDGQQRLTTLYLLMLAGADAALRGGHSDFASGLINANLAIPFTQSKINTKLVPSYADCGQFHRIFKGITARKEYPEEMRSAIRAPSPTGSTDGKLYKQYIRIRKHMTKRLRDHGINGLRELISAASANLTFVFIVLKDPASATTVFAGLNDPGMPIGTGDLVRNEVFARVGDDPERAHELHQNYWRPFQEKLGKHFDDFFFPYCVMHEPSTSKADMFRRLRDMWGKDREPTQIVNELDLYTEPYLAVAGDDGALAKFSKPVAQGISRLVHLKRPSAVHPFTLALLRNNLDGETSDDFVAECLAILESFLVRRALCGVEPTGLLGLFRHLWQKTKDAGGPSGMSDAILRRLTVEWPDDDRLKESILTRPIYGASICNYALVEYDRSLGSDYPEGAAVPWIEHILPQTMTDEWRLHVTDDEHRELVNTWGNLLPLSAGMNIKLSNKSYEAKREVLEKHSMFSSARALASDNDEWTASTVRARGLRLAEWAVRRWPRPAKS